jgi:hypothetical protein
MVKWCLEGEIQGVHWPALSLESILWSIPKESRIPIWRRTAVKQAAPANRTEETVSLYAFALALYSWKNCRRQRLVRLSCLSRMLQQAVRLLAPRICASEGCTCHQDWRPDIQEANVVRPTNPLATGPFQSFANQLLGNIGYPTSLLALCLFFPPFRGWRPWGWSCGRRWFLFMFALVDWRWGWHSCWLLR